MNQDRETKEEISDLTAGNHEFIPLGFSSLSCDLLFVEYDRHVYSVYIFSFRAYEIIDYYKAISISSNQKWFTTFFFSSILCFLFWIQSDYMTTNGNERKHKDRPKRY